MALPPLATVNDLSAWIGRSLTDTGETMRAEAVLSHASTRVRTYVGQSWVDESGELGDVPDVVRDVTVRVAARAFRNPEDLDSVTLDDGTKRWGAVRGLALTDEDREDLAAFLDKTLPAGLGVLSTTRDDPAGSTLYVPTAPEPSGYPFPWYDADDPLVG